MAVFHNRSDTRGSFAAARQLTFEFLERPMIGNLMQRLSSMTHDQSISPVLVSRLVSTNKEWEKMTLEIIAQGLIVPQSGRFSTLSSAFNSLDRDAAALLSQAGAIALLAKVLLARTGYSPNSFIAHMAATTRLTMLQATENSEPAFKVASAAVMHDIGFLVLAATDEEFYRHVSTNGLAGKPLIESEREHFGTDHCELGGLILMALQFADYVIAACQNHHRLDSDVSWIVKAVRSSDSAVAQLGGHLGFGAMSHQVSGASDIAAELSQEFIVKASEIVSESSRKADLVLSQDAA